MKKFLSAAQNITTAVSVVAGFVAALAAGLLAFKEEMNKHYSTATETKKQDNETNSN